MSLEADLAALQAHHEGLEKKFDEYRAEQKEQNEKFDSKLDDILGEMREQKANKKTRAMMWSGVRHLVSMCGAVYLAKKLHVPIDLP